MTRSELLAALAVLALAATPGASVSAQQPGNTQTICELKSGPRAGERMRLRGSSATLPIGSPCGDGEGSTGVVVPKDATAAGPGSPESRRTHRTCMIEFGRRAGHRESGVTPARLGAPCRTRDGSSGVIVADPPTPTKENPTLGGIPQERCRPNSNPRLPLVCTVPPP